MTTNIFVLKGELNGKNRSGAFLFLSGIYAISEDPNDVPEFCGVSLRSAMFAFLKVKIISRYNILVNNNANRIIIIPRYPI